MKVKIIDILNRIANNKEVPKKIIDFGKVYIYNPIERDYHEINSSASTFLYEKFGKSLSTGDWLSSDIQILEDETDEIKELPRSDSYYTQIEDNKNKINELVRAVNKIQKEQVLTKSLNIISDCAKETDCMSD